MNTQSVHGCQILCGLPNRIKLLGFVVCSGDFEHVLTIINELSRFAQLVPLPSKDKHTVADSLISHFITLFGRHRLSWQTMGQSSQQFISEFVELMGSKTRVTTPYHPSSNGLVKHLNRVIKDALYSLCEGALDN